MKFLMSFLMVLVFSQSASASDIKLNDGDMFLTSPEKVEILDVSELCPGGAICVTNGTVVTLDFGFLGCSDRLGPVHYHAVMDSNSDTLNIYVAASLIRNKKSMVEFCTALPKARKTISLINMYGEVKVHLLKGI